jgi:hypothetical protein
MEQMICQKSSQRKNLFWDPFPIQFLRSSLDEDGQRRHRIVTVAYFTTTNGRFPAPGVFVRTVSLNCLSESVPQNSKMIQNGGISARTEGSFCPVELQGGNTNYRAHMRAINTFIGASSG